MPDLYQTGPVSENLFYPRITGGAGRPGTLAERARRSRSTCAVELRRDKMFGIFGMKSSGISNGGINL